MSASPSSRDTRRYYTVTLVALVKADSHTDAVKALETRAKQHLASMSGTPPSVEVLSIRSDELEAGR